MSSRKALAFSFLDRYAGLVLSIISSMVVARLLTPAEIGVFSVAMVLLSFISTMRDFGAGQYLVQEPELTTERIRATWTVQLTLGLTFALIVLAAAIPVSRFYGEPRMRDIMFLLALNFAISPFGSLTYAWLMREMRFDSLAVMRLGGSLSGACVSIGMAWYGFGAISLAAGSLAATIANAAVATLLRPASFPWLPGMVEVRRVVTFGSRISLTNVVNTLGASVPELVLGKAQSMASVGLYSRANGLAAMFQRLVLDATQAVAMPLFAKAVREGQSLSPIFTKATAYLTAIGWSFFGVMIVLAFPIVRVLYGDQWDASVPVVQLIAGSMALGLPAAFCPTTLLATGATGTLLRITALTMGQSAVLMAVGAALGLVQLGWAIMLASIVSVGIWLWMSPIMRKTSKRSFISALLHSALVAAATTTASSLALLWNVDGAAQHLIRLTLAMSLASIAFVLATYLSGHPLRNEFNSLRATLRRA
jgi:O-antigen/teichoic acid export membrane protein